MKKRTSHVLAILLAVCLLFSMLAGCSSKSAKTDTQDTQSTAAAETTVGADTQSAAASTDNLPKENVTITQLVWMPDNPDIPLAVADAFMKKYPNVTIDTQMQSGSPEESIQPKAAAKQMPDLLSIDPGSYASSLADEGLLMDLSDTKCCNNQLESVASQFVSDKGVKYGISGGLCTCLIYYNKDMFADAGITEFPSNYQELLDACKKLKAKGYTPMVYTGGDANTLSNANFSYGMSQYLIKGDSKVTDQIKKNEYTFTGDEALKKVLDRTIELPLQGYCNDGWASTGYDESCQMFTAGDVAMIFNGTWLAGSLLSDDVGFDVGCALPPWNDKGEDLVPVVSSETGFACGNTGSDAQKAYAKALLEFWNGEGYALYQNPRGLVPAFNSDSISCKIVLDQRIADVIAKANSYPSSSPLYFVYLPTAIDQQKIIQELLLGTMTTSEACAAFDAAKGK